MINSTPPLSPSLPPHQADNSPQQENILQQTHTDVSSSSAPTPGSGAAKTMRAGLLKRVRSNSDPANEPPQKRRWLEMLPQEFHWKIQDHLGAEDAQNLALTSRRMLFVSASKAETKTMLEQFKSIDPNTDEGFEKIESILRRATDPATPRLDDERDQIRLAAVACVQQLLPSPINENSPFLRFCRIASDIKGDNAKKQAIEILRTAIPGAEEVGIQVAPGNLNIAGPSPATIALLRTAIPGAVEEVDILVAHGNLLDIAQTISLSPATIASLRTSIDAITDGRTRQIGYITLLDATTKSSYEQVRAVVELTTIIEHVADNDRPNFLNKVLDLVRAKDNTLYKWVDRLSELRPAVDHLPEDMQANFHETLDQLEKAANQQLLPAIVRFASASGARDVLSRLQLGVPQREPGSIASIASATGARDILRALTHPQTDEAAE